jgi:hypothetical protein
VCCGGRPRERGIEAQKAPYTAPDRFRPGFEPPLTDVSWVGLAALGGTQYDRYDPPMRARARHGLRWDLVPSLLEAAFYLASLVRTQVRTRQTVRTASSRVIGSGLEATFYLA